MESKASQLKEQILSRNAEQLTIYHEKQSLQFCAKHTLNNLFQSQIFSESSLDAICNRMTKTKNCYNPHKSFFNLGNYDVNVIEKALISLGFCMNWFDMRKNMSEINLIEDTNIFGLIVNSVSKGFFDKIFGTKSHHWLAIKVINNEIYNLDSKLDNPRIMSKSDLEEYLQLLQKQKGQIFIIKQKKKMINQTDDFEILKIDGQETQQELQKVQKDEPGDQCKQSDEPGDIQIKQEQLGDQKNNQEQQSDKQIKQEQLGNQQIQQEKLGNMQIKLDQSNNGQSIKKSNQQIKQNQVTDQQIKQDNLDS